MPAVLEKPTAEFDSGEIVEPGVYIDMENGAIVQVQERDTLPEGVRVVRYKRHFRRLESPAIADKN